MNDKWKSHKIAENQWRWERTAPNEHVAVASIEYHANKPMAMEMPVVWDGRIIRQPLRKVSD